ncbi:helix-turn-helix transcriptional regulator [Actinosynnema sp. NPDC050436]|uniref:helix-turn-helix transcriptional regulator n=1 Tax=Actinosynnema sp. NPDC050436 TaxID=3155659 RepID=UPI0033EE92DD
MAARRIGLIRARRAAGFTQESFAEATHVDRSTVARWEQGTREPLPYQRPKLARLLKITMNELDELLRAEAESVAATQRSIPSARTVPAPRVVRAELLMQYETLTSAYRQIDYQAGSAAVYEHTVSQLHRLMGMADNVPSSCYQRFALILGDTAQLAAWLAIDHQDYGAARRYTSLALSSAQEGEDPQLHAYVLGIMSYIHLHAGRGPDAVRLLLAALQLAENPRFGVGHAVHSWLSEAMGEAYALAGDHRAGAAALAKAERLFDGVDQADVPEWLGFYNGVEHIMRLKGRCLVRLGDGAAAVVALEEAVRALPVHYVRERSGTLIDLAIAHLISSRTVRTSAVEPEAAAAAALEAWELAVQTGSGRNQRRVRELLPQFQPYRQLGAVRTLLDAAP